MENNQMSEDNNNKKDDRPIVLIVDDTATNIGVLGACLRDHYRVKVATRGDQCLKIAASAPKPDIILLDIEMPEMDGYEVCRRLKARDNTKDIPVIFVTGRLGEENEEFGLQLGAVDYITKPISPSIVLARVNTHVKLKLAQDRLRMMALHDQLTSLYNRHYLIEVAEKKVSRAKRHQEALAMLLMDVDHFKDVNDEYGHPAGDEVLKELASLLLKECRTEDIAARFGGEEFVVLLEHCNKAAAEKKAEKIREQFAALKPLGIKVTTSIGVAVFDCEKDNFNSWLKRADEALYEAKAQGRNKVICAEP
jgi:diguanylate cyclase (GGDEF)-like protein